MPRHTDQPVRILEYIRHYASENGYPPSVREIGAAVGLKSTASVARHLRALEASGLISHPPSKRRAWSVEGTRSASQAIQLPLVGKITAGLPVLAVEQQEDTLSLPLSMFRRRPDFLLRVDGDSMIEAGIYSGDLVAVLATSTADSGEIVIARIGEEATVKYLERRPNTVRLLPANPQFNPIEDPEIQILGVVVGLVRSY